MATLSITGICKRYPGRSDNALGGVSLEVVGSEVVALLGRSGSGKSTLLRCINRLVDPDSGTVTFDGTDITALGPRALGRMRRQIGMIFQEFNLVNRLSVIDNVLCGRVASVGVLRCWFKVFPRADVERAEQLLERVGLIDLRYKRADALSGGQRQRVGIARALMQQPRLLLADEPTASLDPVTGAEIFELICDLARTNGIPILISIHDVHLAQKYVERIVALRDGLKVFDGAAAQLDFETIYRLADPASAPVA
ncbi:MAG TPA: phosphonate ABC transporter ATP-binding protein, partial [Burkholderiaceae bacterium]|nr:phosphonate ABC transporter ATP-binding protein [Burkholderiaceae bacterium]